MSVVKHPKSPNYYVRFTAPDGRRVFQSAGTASRRAAEEYEAALKSRLWREHRLGESQATWREAVVSWLAGTTHKDRRNVTQRLRWLDDHLGDLRLAEIDGKVLGRIRETKTAEGASGATVNRYLAVVSAVLNHAKADGKLPNVPTIPRMKEAGGRLRWLSFEEADRLIAHLEKDPKRRHLLLMVKFSLATGLREANVCGLRWSRVDLDRAMAWVPAKESKTNKPLNVPLSDLALEVLDEARGGHEEWVFTYRGKRVTRCNNSSFRKAVAALGWDDVTWHTLRHTWASWQVMAGVPLEVVQHLGGWTSIRMVLHYAHLAPDHLASFAGKGVENWQNAKAKNA